MRGILITCTVLATVSISTASQPGQPLDCSDWAFVAPGITCGVAVPYGGCPDAGPSPPPICVNAGGAAALSDGRIVGFESADLPYSCGPTWTWPPQQVRLVAYRGNVPEIIAHVNERCVSAHRMDRIITNGLVHDVTNGVLHGLFRVSCESDGAESCPMDYDRDGTVDADPGATKVVWTFSGFPTLFDMLHSFAPNRLSTGFRVPSSPEGFPAADYFDTYSGEITRPLDLSQAHPLQCAYPSAPPQRGDYEAITAPVPTPAPGHANYILTSVTYQSQTRAGRQAIDGHLHGRDASSLPPCVIETKDASVQTTTASVQR